MSKIKALVAVAIASALIVGGSVPATQAAGKTLTIGMVADVTSFRVPDATFGNANLYYQTVYDTLLQETPDGKIIPSAATAWKWDPSSTKLTLTIRSGMKFTDGTPVNAAAVVANLNRFVKGGTSTEKGTLANMKIATATGPNTVVITLKNNDPAFELYLTKSAALLESPKNFTNPAEKTEPVGSGPYKLDKLKSKFGSSYTFVKNPGYWNAKAVKFDTVVLKVISDSTAAVNALKAGQIDGMNVTKADSIPSLEASNMNFATQYNDWVGLVFADRSGKQGTPLKNVKVRQAINMAFDRPAMLAALRGKYGVVTQQIFGTKSQAYVKSLDSYYKYDVAGAKKLLAEAGYPDGFTIKMPSMAAYSGPARPALIAAQLKAIGITVQYVPETLATFVTNVLTPKYAAWDMALERSPSDWANINYAVSKTAGWNADKFSDATTIDLISQIQESRAANRKALLQKLNTYLVEQAWFCPWYANQTTFAHTPKIKVSVQPGNVMPYLFNYSPAN